MSTGYHADEIVFVRREKAGPVASAWEFRQRIGATELATPFSGEKAFQPTIAHVAATRLERWRVLGVSESGHVNSIRRAGPRRPYRRCFTGHRIRSKISFTAFTSNSSA